MSRLHSLRYPNEIYEHNVISSGHIHAGYSEPAHAPTPAKVEEPKQPKNEDILGEINKALSVPGAKGQKKVGRGLKILK
jgi:hypothetical protein